MWIIKYLNQITKSGALLLHSARLVFFNLHWAAGLSHALWPTALHFTALPSTAMYCTSLNCPVLHRTALQRTALLHGCTVVHFTAMHCTALHCTALQLAALHCTELNNISLLWTLFHFSALYLTALFFETQPLDVEWGAGQLRLVMLWSKVQCIASVKQCSSLQWCAVM